MKRNVLAVLAVFVALPVMRLASESWSQPSVPAAKGGVLDLRRWNPDSGRIVSLKGEWAFYPGVFLQPGQSVPAENKRLIKVPGGWDPVIGSAFGFGTYQLEILLPEPGPGVKRTLALRTSIVRTASEMFVGSVRIGGGGKPGISRETSMPHALPYTAFFEAGARAELTVHVSNFEYARSGGIFQDIRLGSVPAMERQTVLQVVQNAVTMGFFLTCGVFFLMLWLLRRKNREYLYFSLFFWMSLLFWLTHNERFLFHLIPGLPYPLQMKLVLLPSAILFASLLGFVRWMYPDYAFSWTMRAAAAGAGAFSGIFLLTDVSFYSRLEPELYLFDLIMVLYAGYLLMREALRNNRDSVLTLIAALCIVYESVFQGLYYWGNNAAPNFLRTEIIVFAAAMSMAIAKRFIGGIREVEILSKRLIVADRLRNDFLATTSNELRLPLHGMINIAQVMANEEDLGERQRERLSLLMATGRRLSRLLSDMLDLSKLNEGGLELQRRPVDIRMLIAVVADVMHDLKGGRSVRFDNRVEAGTPPVTGDEHRLMQILFHLFHYAVRWGAEGSVEVHAELKEDGQTVEIAVLAKGKGIKPEDSGGVTAGAEDFSLEISRKLIGLHGSELAVYDTKGQLRIAFRLESAGEEPAAPGSHGRQPLPQAPGPENGENAAVWRHVLPEAPKVLVVDDDPVSLRVMFDVMVQERLDVTALTDGDEALRLIEREGGWDLIVLDSVLPRLSGYEICRKIRERHSFYDLPVLFLVVRNQPDFLLVGFDAGANDYVTKPVETSEFRARTRTLLRMKQSIRERLDIEMALIQAQIKPHFLYNTLNTIASLSEIDPDRTRDLLADFGSYLQSCFDLRNLDRKVPFEKEWKLVKSYLNIEQARFGSRIRVTYDLPGHPSFTLPPLTIQPIVENALRHGALKRFEGGWIHISVTETPGYMRIAVRDNGDGFPPAKKAAVLDGSYRPGIGLVNVNRRLKNAYGHGLQIDSSEGEWTEVGFEVPISEGKEEIA